MSTDLATNLYGNFPIKIGRMTGLKHTLNPKLTFSWIPEYDKYGLFKSFSGIGSAGSRYERMTMGINLNNSFSLKYMKDDDEKKINLFNLNISSTYDFKSEERKFSNISSSITSNILNRLNVNLSTEHSLYSAGSNTVNGFFLKNAKISSSVGYSGMLNFDDESRKWNVSLSHYLSQDFSSSYSTIQWVRSSINTNITKNWNISYDLYFDLENMEKVTDQFVIKRDMRCWEGIFKWIPTGDRAGYYLKISVKEIPEIKVQSSKGGVTI